MRSVYLHEHKDFADLLRILEEETGILAVYSGETDHPIPWQTDHLKGWRTVVSNAIEL